MDRTNIIVRVLKALVEELIEERYDEIVSYGKNGRLTIEEIHNALKDYGGKLTYPELDDYIKANIIEVSDSPEYVVEYELWIDNKKSDLTLSCTVRFNTQNNANIYIDDIHVL